MKILYGITKSNFGGAQRYVFELATEMKGLGHDVSVVCGQEGLLVDKLREGDIKTLTLSTLSRDISLLGDFKSFLDIFHILRKEHPDVFHVNSSKMGGLGALAGRLVGIKKIIFTGHGWGFNEPRSWWQRFIIKFFVWLTIVLSHKTICVSEGTKNDVENFPFIKRKLSVIYNGLAEFKLVERQGKTFTVGTIAELHKVKGLDVLLEAWKKFIKNREAKLVIIGSGEEKTNLEKMASNLDILDSVEFSGFIDNARKELSRFDIFVLPSRSEAFPYAPLEAGLASLPVIATRVGGIPEIIESGVTGILVPKEDSEAIFSSLVLLYEDPDLRKRLGTALYHFVKEKFSIKEMLEKTSNLYR